MERNVDFDLHSTEVHALNAPHGMGHGDDRSNQSIRLRATRAEAKL